MNHIHWYFQLKRIVPQFFLSSNGSATVNAPQCFNNCCCHSRYPLSYDLYLIDSVLSEQNKLKYAENLAKLLFSIMQWLEIWFTFLLFAINVLSSYAYLLSNERRHSFGSWQRVTLVTSQEWNRLEAHSYLYQSAVAIANAQSSFITSSDNLWEEHCSLKLNLAPKIARLGCG